jgi:hypothetical protein
MSWRAVPVSAGMLERSVTVTAVADLFVTPTDAWKFDFHAAFSWLVILSLATLVLSCIHTGELKFILSYFTESGPYFLSI